MQKKVVIHYDDRGGCTQQSKLLGRVSQRFPPRDTTGYLRGYDLIEDRKKEDTTHKSIRF